MAMDETALNIATGGSMYPDHVIFLGAATQVVQQDESIAKFVQQFEIEPACIVVPELGTLMHKESNASQQAMARCLADVCLRISSDASIRYLTAEEEYQLLNWEAETYRQSIAT